MTSSCKGLFHEAWPVLLRCATGTASRCVGCSDHASTAWRRGECCLSLGGAGCWVALRRLCLHAAGGCPGAWCMCPLCRVRRSDPGAGGCGVPRHASAASAPSAPHHRLPPTRQQGCHRALGTGCFEARWLKQRLWPVPPGCKPRPASHALCNLLELASQYGCGMRLRVCGA